MITLGFKDPFLEPKKTQYFARAVGATSGSPKGCRDTLKLMHNFFDSENPYESLWTSSQYWGEAAVSTGGGPAGGLVGPAVNFTQGFPQFSCVHENNAKNYQNDAPSPPKRPLRFQNEGERPHKRRLRGSQ